MTAFKTFWLEPTNRDACYLRRFVFSDSVKCPLKQGYHNATARIEDDIRVDAAIGDNFPHEDPRWPKHCACGYEFQDADQWQLFKDRIYKRLDTGETMPLRDAPVGALWNAEWLAGKRHHSGPDGLSVHCRTPGGDWGIDCRANNCTMKDDAVHKCWVRHGTFGETVHVDKNGNTCAAGAGSIQCNDYHGFLDYGFLTTQRGVYS